MHFRAGAVCCKRSPTKRFNMMSTCTYHTPVRRNCCLKHLNHAKVSLTTGSMVANPGTLHALAGQHSHATPVTHVCIVQVSKPCKQLTANSWQQWQPRHSAQRTKGRQCQQHTCITACKPAAHSDTAERPAPCSTAGLSRHQLPQ
jgi:hypothetical protein